MEGEESAKTATAEAPSVPPNPAPAETPLWTLSIRTVGSPSPSRVPPSTAVLASSASAPAPPATPTPAGGVGGKVAATPAADGAPGGSATATAAIGTDGHHVPFTVRVDPDADTLDSLHRRIWERTGLPVELQRLIYRGKIISSGGGGGSTGGGGEGTTARSSGVDGNGRQKVLASASGSASAGGLLRDVAGLGDGHTIHLVPRPAPPPAPAAAAAAAAASSSPSALGGGADADDATSDALLSALLGADSGSSAASAGSGSAALLAALLGLGLGGSSGGNRGAATATAGAGAATTGLAAPAAPPGTSDLLGSEIGQLLTGGTGLSPTAATATTAAATAPATATRAAAGGARRHRRGTTRPSHILTAEDLEERRGQRLGSLEPVRQGLMTTHTILHGAGLLGSDTAASAGSSSSSTERRGLPRRRFYRGQWVDALDTVNSWLEATIVDIASPEDVLGVRPSTPSTYSQHHHGEANPHRNRRSGLGGVVRRDEDGVNGEEGAQHRAGSGRQARPQADPIVGANDWQGRRMLLLEPDPDADDFDPTDRACSSVGGQDLSSYRERPSNTENDVQLLLIHYNGWPRRWDEWVRSDSPRIRPFRSRTRHAIGEQSGRRQRQSHPDQGRVGACPSIRAAFHAAPPTHICPRGPGTPLLGNEETTERIAALMELRSVLRNVDGLIAACIEDHECTSSFGETDDGESSNRVEREDFLENYRREFDGDAFGEEIVDEDGNASENDDDDEGSISRFFGDDDSFLEGDEEDRNRYLPWKCQEQRASSAVEMDLDTTTAVAVRRLEPVSRLNTLGPLLDRVGRVCVSLGPHVSAMGEDYPMEREVNQTVSIGDGHREGEDVNENEVGGNWPGIRIDEAPSRGGGGGGGGDDGDEVSDEEDEDDLFSADDQRGIASNLSQDNTVWWSSEPDMADYSNAIVNDSPSSERSPARSSTPRNQNRGGGTSLADNITSALLAAALVSSTGVGGGGRGGTIGSTAAAGAAEPSAGNGVESPRLINLGSGNVMSGGPGLGSGIDIHVTMLVSPGGGGAVSAATTAGEGGIGGVSAHHAASTNNALMTPTAHAPASSFGIDEQDDGLFDELYTETPSPASWDRSATRVHDDDSSNPPSTFDPYDDEDENIVDNCSVDNISLEDSNESSFESEPAVLSEIESNDDSEEEPEEEMPAASASVLTFERETPAPTSSTPSTPSRAVDENIDEVGDAEPAAYPSSRSTPRSSPLSRLFRRSRRRRNN